jgi:hypothetical protein
MIHLNSHQSRWKTEHQRLELLSLARVSFQARFAFLLRSPVVTNKRRNIQPLHKKKTNEDRYVLPGCPTCLQIGQLMNR